MNRFILIAFLICSSLVYSQAGILEKADKLYDRESFLRASTEFDKYLQETIEEKVSADTWMKIGDTHYNLNDKERAIIGYRNAFALVGYKMPRIHLHQYYDALRALRGFEQADELYINYLESTNQTKLLQEYKDEAKRFKVVAEEDTLYDVFALDVNSSYSDFGGTLKGETLIFSSSRESDLNKIYERDETPYLSLFKAKRNTSQHFTDVQLFDEGLETPFHDASASFDPDGTTIYYASSYLKNDRKKIFGKEKRNYFRVYKAVKNGDRYEKLEVPINGEDYSTGHPYTEDGMLLYFASDRPGGYGGADIYVCDIRPNGTYSAPRNLGPTVNTPYDDYFPFVKDGILYFSSKGHVGFGGIDIYKAERVGNSFVNVKNMGLGINSKADDFAYREYDDGLGYISSNRVGGYGGDDIYAFEYRLRECWQYIKGNVVDSETKEPIQDARIKFITSQGDELATLMTDKNGYYELRVECRTKVLISASKKGFSEESTFVDMSELPEDGVKVVDFELDDLSEIIVVENDVEKIRIDPIHFDYDKYNINTTAANQLQKIIDVMNDFPEMIIKIESHTDQRGSEPYNLALSDKRAKSTQQYLFEKGISQDRITSARGFGESEPIYKCPAGDCTEEEYSKNRRSDFIIISR